LIHEGRREVKGAFIIDGDPTESVILNEVSPIISRLYEVRVFSLSDVNPLLGQTFDFLVLDLRWSFQPNKVSLLIETVRGGGIVLICGLPVEEWIMTVNPRRFPSSKEFRHESQMLGWFLENVQQNSQCVIENMSSQELLRRFNPMPYTVNLTAKIAGFYVTPDQKEVILTLIENLSNTSNSDSCHVIVANRGRGKSASVGIAIFQLIIQGYLQKQRHKRVVVTAPELSNTQTLFEFIEKGLRKRQVNFRVNKENGLITEVYIPNKIRISYSSPSDISNETRSSLVIVDEAAALPIEKLRSIIQTPTKKVLISTIHGYEGAGRGFQYKIIQYLKRQTRVKYRILSLSIPIRYLEGDLIEQLLNETFLLDVEIKITDVESQDIDRELLILEEYDDPTLLFSKFGIHHLRRLFGLLIYAHYRNQPNDLLLLADSEKHFLLGLVERKDQNDTTLIVASHLAKEGELSEEIISRIAGGEFIPGNLIPAIAIRHFSTNFAHLRGLRIVRIAALPKFLGKGFGRLAIEAHIKKYKDKYDWIGVSHGATTNLVKFWKKLGFFPVHIRPTKTPASGEWNIVFILPFSYTSEEIVLRVSADFSLQFISLLKQSLFEMRPELVIQILKACYPVKGYTPNLTPTAQMRLTNYINGHLNFLLAVDAMYELAVLHFVFENPIKLSPSQEMLLVSRILQGRTWGQMLGKTGLTWKSAQSLMKKTIKKLVDSYL
jgi:tRNA(Met) cytidine acetyltransferase